MAADTYIIYIVIIHGKGVLVHGGQYQRWSVCSPSLTCRPVMSTANFGEQKSQDEVSSLAGLTGQHQWFRYPEGVMPSQASLRVACLGCKVFLIYGRELKEVLPP